jgi:hypothetical protein
MREPGVQGQAARIEPQEYARRLVEEALAFGREAEALPFA